MNPTSIDKLDKLSDTRDSEQSTTSNNKAIIIYPTAPQKNISLRSCDPTVTLTTNLLSLELSKSSQKLCIYSVTVEPQLANDNFSLLSKIYRQIDVELNKIFTRKCFSGNNLFASSKNPPEFKSFHSHVENVSYELKILKVGELDITNITDFEGVNQRKKSFLEKVIKDILLKNKNAIKFGDDRTIVKVGEKNVIHDSNSRESIYKGYFTSAQITENGLYLLCLNVNKHVSEITVYEAISEIRNQNRNLSESEIRKIIEEYFVTHKTVLTVYGSLRTYRIQAIDFDKNPENTTFNIKNSNDNQTKSITVLEYFKKQYKVDIKYKDQPLLLAEKKTKNKKLLSQNNNNENNINNEEDIPIYLVPELLYTTGVNNNFENKDRRRNIISKTKVDPNRKLEEIKGIYEMINDNNDPKNYKGKDGNIYKSKTASEVANEWGINIGKNLEIKGRILPQPKLNYGNNNIVTPINGTFRSGNVREGVILNKENFFYVYDKKDKDDIRNSLRGLLEKCRFKGLKIERFQPSEIHGLGLENTNTWENIKNVLCRINNNDGRIQLGIIFLSPHLEKYYGHLKEFFTNTLHIPSQCIVSKKLQDQRRAGSIMFNIVDQINVKMGGTNFFIDFYGSNILNRNKIYLVAGLECKQISNNEMVYLMTSSTNKNLNKIITTPKKCKNNKEEKEKTIENLINIAINELKSHGAPHPPDYIIIYRQGGNKVQNRKTASIEVPMFNRALNILKEKSLLFKEINTKLIYVCCNLKNDLKFFEKCEKGNINYKNPQSGLCVDESVTTKDKYEFYIQPQFVNQGTATPCHYQVLYQDIDSNNPSNNLKIEQLEKLSFYLSFYYWTWAGAVRVPGTLKLATTAMDFFSRHLNNKLCLPNNRFQSPYYI